jgi:acetoin utilization deacetylase AcuC-like enzyme
MVATVDSFSPSAGKPREVVEDWTRRFSCNGENGVAVMLGWAPITKDQLYVAHSRRYVDGVLAGKLPNGFGTHDPAVAQACTYTVGSMYISACVALRSPDGIACSPSSGFHHAGPDRGHGYCTFNGLAVTALLLGRKGIRVTILDCDRHFGDGTAAILEDQERRGNKHGIEHYSVGDRLSDKSPAAFLDSLRAALDDITQAVRMPDLVLYQAGADMHEADPLGGFLTSEQMQERDRMVFRETGRAGISVAWNLAGGYQRDAKGGIEPVLALHRATLHEALHCDYGPVERAMLRRRRALPYLL